MATPGLTSEVIYHDALVNYLVSMARAAETAVNRAIEALLGERGERTSAIASQIFLLEPRINEMEIVIDEHALKLLRRGNLPEHEIRLVVATLKITNDLERMGDLAVNIGERVISLAQMPPVVPPEELGPMAAAVRAMVEKTLWALIFRNISLANQVLESDDFIDQSRDRLFQHLLASMTAQHCPGHPLLGAHCRPRNQHRRRHDLLAAGSRRTPRSHSGPRLRGRGCKREFIVA